MKICENTVFYLSVLPFDGWRKQAHITKGKEYDAKPVYFKQCKDMTVMIGRAIWLDKTKSANRPF